jgi:hypothetical protein
VSSTKSKHSYPSRDCNGDGIPGRLKAEKLHAALLLPTFAGSFDSPSLRSGSLRMTGKWIVAVEIAGQAAADKFPYSPFAAR